MCISSMITRALHWVPIPMSMGFEWVIVHGCAWVRTCHAMGGHRSLLMGCGLGMSINSKEMLGSNDYETYFATP